MWTLYIAARNTEPVREPRYPSSWVLYKGGQEFAVDVAHDLNDRPRVITKTAA
jgi:hypothetical protein